MFKINKLQKKYKQKSRENEKSMEQNMKISKSCIFIENDDYKIKTITSYLH